MNSNSNICPNCLEEMAPEQTVCPHCGYDRTGYLVLPHQLVPGTLIKQRYQVGRVLGEGGFGITYVGRDTVLNLKIAIKEFYMSGYVNRNHDASLQVFATLGTHQDTFNKNKDKFLTEARVLARFYEEPGIVGVRDFCEENGTAYIIMDFLDGVTLKEYLEQQGNLTPTRAVQLLMPVMRSLQHVHGEGIIHRDISPDNIMVLQDGRTKLLDFGAAREVSKTDIKSLSVILKPGYAPEEQYRSKGHQGPWTDVYALAATLYRCIVGTAPDDAMERMYRDQLPAPAQTDARCPVAISNVIMKGLAVRQPDRYQTVGELLADLEQALADPDNAALAPDRREVRAGDRTAVDSSHTVLADLPTGRTQFVGGQGAQSQPSAGEYTVLADAPVAEPAAQTPPSAASRQGPAPGTAGAPAPAAHRPAQKAKADPKATTATAPRPTPPQPAQPSSKKKKLPVVPLVAAAAVVIVAAVALMPRGGNPAPSGQSASSVQTGTESTAQPVEDSPEYRTLLLNGQTIQLPVEFRTLADQGWVFQDEEMETQTIPAGGKSSASGTTILNEYGSMDVVLANYTNQELAAADCVVVQLQAAAYSFNDNYLDQVGNSLSMVRGGALGESVDGVLDQYPGIQLEDNSAQLTTTDSTLHFSLNDEREIQSIRVSTTVIPDWVDTTTVSQEMPAEYADPDFLANYGLQGFSLTYQGHTYQMPLMVQDLIDAGWTLERGPQQIPAYSHATVYLRLDVRTTISFDAYNFTASAIVPQYGIAAGLYCNKNDDPSVSLSYQGSELIRLGQSQSETLQAARQAGLTVEQINTDRYSYSNGGYLVVESSADNDGNIVLISLTMSSRYYDETGLVNNFYDYEQEE